MGIKVARWTSLRMSHAVYRTRVPRTSRRQPDGTLARYLTAVFHPAEYTVKWAEPPSRVQGSLKLEAWKLRLGAWGTCGSGLALQRGVFGRSSFHSSFFLLPSLANAIGSSQSIR
jgi:hypothetical protein